MKNKHWKTYITDYKRITGDLNWLRIESTYKPSYQDVEQVTKEKGFTDSPKDIEHSFSKGSFITTWSVEK